MSDIEFAEEQYSPVTLPQQAEAGFSLVGLLQKWGIVESEPAANMLLLGIAILGILISVYILMSQGSRPVPQPAVLRPAQVMQP